MKRREFISLVSGAAAWPLTARAQQGERVRRISVLMTTAQEDPQGQAQHAAFLKALELAGWLHGRNAQIDTRWPAGDPQEIRRNVAEVVALAPDVIVAIGAVTVGPLLQATRTVPVVFAIVPDPVGAGFVESLSRPTRNATGFMQFEYNLSGKWLELLKQIAPSVTRAAVPRDPATSGGASSLLSSP